MACGRATNRDEVIVPAGRRCAGSVPFTRIASHDTLATGGSCLSEPGSCPPAVNGSIIPTVARLARQLHAGDLSALGQLYDATSPRLARYALTLTGNTHDAEDSLQACMIRLAENPCRVASARHAWAYCLKVLRNETLRIVRRRQPTRSLTHLPQEPADAVGDINTEDQTSFIRRALKRLPPEQREVVVLKIWENMTFLEISEIVGESANTVSSRYRYALQKLSLSLRPLAEVGHD